MEKNTNQEEVEELKEITEASPSVQTHLSIMQSVIERMATNSASSKAWCISIVSAILVVVADKGKPDYVLIAVLPTFLFFALDSYYLALEKGFRKSYNHFVGKLHRGRIEPEDLYSLAPKGSYSSLQLEAMKSFSVWGFYVTLMALIFIARLIVLE